jgi:tetratricopeptide (TPR) repeat protein
MVLPLRVEAEKIGYKPLLAEAKLREGSLEMELGKLPEAETSLSAALALGIASAADPIALEALSKRIFLRAAAMGQPATAVADVSYGRAFLERVDSDPSAKWLFFNNVGVMYEYQGDLAAAEAAYRQLASAGDITQLHGLSAMQTAIVLSNMGNLHMRVATDPGRAVAPFTEALRLTGAALGSHHPRTLGSGTNLAIAQLDRGNYREAQALLDTTIVNASDTFGGESETFGVFLAQRGLLELELHDFDAAAQTLQKALQLTRGAAADDGPHNAWIVANLAAAHGGRGDWARASELFERAVALLEVGDPIVLTSVLDIHGRMLCLKGDHEGCLARFQRAVQLREAKLPPGTPSIGYALDGVGQALTKLGRHDEAQVALERARDILEKGLSPDSPLIARVQRSLGELSMARGDAAAAVTHFQRSLDVFAMVRDPEDGEMAVARINLAQALAARAGATASDHSAATATVTEALAVLERRGAGWTREREAASTWLKSQV